MVSPSQRRQRLEFGAPEKLARFLASDVGKKKLRQRQALLKFAFFGL